MVRLLYTGKVRFVFQKNMLPKAKKQFGQNFLINTNVVKRIIEAAEIKKGENVLEIGPGTGILTEALVEAGAKVVAVELDESLIDSLQEKFDEKIKLFLGNALKLELPVKDKKFKLVANIPYNITSEIIEKFLSKSPRPTKMVLMVQREVADRITAKPPKMSLLSVVCQVYAKCQRVMVVKAGSFRPIPKVDSAVVQFDLKEKYEFDPEEVIKIAKIGFSSRRKQLHKNLSSSLKIDSEMIKEILEKMKIDPKVRAENLTVDEWVSLSEKMNKNV
jgi:16S rRNA (adenine1518-N6/adenine1519-N6)-dimethyltransferase